MPRFEGFGGGNLPVLLALAAIILAGAYALLRIRNQRDRRRRRDAWLAKRAEEDRLWNERIGAE